MATYTQIIHKRYLMLKVLTLKLLDLVPDSLQYCSFFKINCIFSFRFLKYKTCYIFI